MTVEAAVDFEVPIKTEAGLRLFLKRAFGVVVPNTKVCPTHSTPWAALCDSFFARHPVVVWKASRGFGGKTFLLSLLSVTEAISYAADVAILGGSGEQSQRALNHMETLWGFRNAPRYLLNTDPTKREQRLVWGNRIHALMASTASVRGPHPQRLRGDEIDEMKVEILDAALGQTMSKPDIPAQTTLSSTHHYIDGTMTDILHRAAERGWPVHEWCWRETIEPNGWLLRSEVERKRLEVPVSMWAAEYDLQEPSPEGRAIDTEAVVRMFKQSLGKFNGADGETVIAESYVPVGKYVAAADWARKHDRTEICVLRTDVRPMRIVAYKAMRRQPWPIMVGAFGSFVSMYHANAVHDGTGIGDVVDGYMTYDAKPIIMAGRFRNDIVSNVISAIERNEIEAPMIQSLYNQLRYCTTEDVYGTGHLPDGLAMLSLVWHGANNRGTWQTGRGV